ncbi:hypothetical protein PHK61_07800 [Actinomycetospora lutea]|uniref:hypothetical protein n=1 Tax=Actinomycetospora lutea TaxID=663604 RepID=UPI002366BC7F|nr:hypothetical protein [Actinomycetospora lutea]MDD7938319.1 hypothetical protein [Actinomycetospora lutea]
MNGSSARVASVIAVVLVACGFDLLADESLLHVLGVALAAASVGVVRLALRGRLQGLFVVVNLAVLVQPAAHALTTLTQAGAARLHHEHVVPEHLTALALQLAITLLVVVVASSEPLLVAGRHAHLRLLRAALGLAPVPAPGTPRPRPPEPAARVGRPAALLRCRPHRGPPAVAVSVA